MFEAVYGLKTIGNFNTFKEAFKALYDAILIDKDISIQILETATWIEADDIPIPFFDARDVACRYKWLINGKWQEGT